MRREGSKEERKKEGKKEEVKEERKSWWVEGQEGRRKEDIQ